MTVIQESTGLHSHQEAWLGRSTFLSFFKFLAEFISCGWMTEGPSFYWLLPGCCLQVWGDFLAMWPSPLGVHIVAVCIFKANGRNSICSLAQHNLIKSMISNHHCHKIEPNQGSEIACLCHILLAGSKSQALLTLKKRGLIWGTRYDVSVTTWSCCAWGVRGAFWWEVISSYKLDSTHLENFLLSKLLITILIKLLYLHNTSLPSLCWISL